MHHGKALQPPVTTLSCNGQTRWHCGGRGGEEWSVVRREVIKEGDLRWLSEGRGTVCGGGEGVERVGAVGTVGGCSEGAGAGWQMCSG